MNDRAVSLLDQYEIEVKGTRKGRGAILCDTDRGTLIFKEYGGHPDHLKVQDRLLKTIAAKGLLEVEELIPAREGELFVKDGDGTLYILKTYREGRECNVRETEECSAAARLLAKLHLSTQDGLLPEWKPAEGEEVRDCEANLPAFSIAAEYEKRNRELRRIRKFLLGRSQKTWFEISLLGCFDGFYEQAREVRDDWESYRALAQGEPLKAYCHGDYQHHNVILDQRDWVPINFERCIKDDPVRDLQLFLRKLLEKNNWSVALGERLLREYERIRPLSAVSRIDLYYRLSYPEKFWKIANFYYNSAKAWIPGKNLEKLEKLIAQEAEKKHFLENVFQV